VYHRLPRFAKEHIKEEDGVRKLSALTSDLFKIGFDFSQGMIDFMNENSIDCQQERKVGRPSMMQIT
jgi:cob(I)alamin adenosyltransferase